MFFGSNNTSDLYNNLTKLYYTNPLFDIIFAISVLCNYVISIDITTPKRNKLNRVESKEGSKKDMPNLHIVLYQFQTVRSIHSIK